VNRRGRLQMNGPMLRLVVSPYLRIPNRASSLNSGRFRCTQLHGRNRITGTTRAGQGRDKSMKLYSVDWKEGTGPGPRLKDIVGQEQAVARLRAFAQLHESSGTAPGHILLIAPEGMGQMLIAAAFAGEFGANSMAMTKGPEFEVFGDLTSLFTNLRERQFLLMPDVQFLRKSLWKGLREIMHSNQLMITIGQGPAARNHVMEIRPFTMIATCSKLRDCPSELLDGFSLVLNLEPYWGRFRKRRK